MTETALAQRMSNRPARTAGELVESMRGELAKALPEHVTVDTFLRLALTELRVNEALQRCTTSSLLGALMTAARLGLEPGGPLGQFYLTPRSVKRESGERLSVVVPIVGYEGLRDLAYRSGLVRVITSVVVREGDSFAQGASSERGRWFEWQPWDSSSERPIIGVLGLAELSTGARVHRYLDMPQILARKARGAAGDKGPWGTDFEAMVLKTGIRALAHELPKSATFALALGADERVQTFTPNADARTWQPETTPAEADDETTSAIEAANGSTPDES